jgi:hypothetical protein
MENIDNDVMLNIPEIQDINFKKPKKVNEYMVSKMNYLSKQIIVQLPKMKINEIKDNKIHFKCIPDHKNSKKVIEIFKKTDSIVTETIANNSEEWFGKIITLENVKKMYSAFIKENTHYSLNIRNNSVFVDFKNNVINLEDIDTRDYLECIINIKFLVFSRNICYLKIELIKAKKCRIRISRVRKYGFIEDTNDHVLSGVSDSDNSDYEDDDLSFY